MIVKDWTNNNSCVRDILKKTTTTKTEAKREGKKVHLPQLEMTAKPTSHSRKQ